MFQEKRFTLSMLFLRASVSLVMLMWTIDKFINPGHAAKVFEKFYSIPGVDHTILYVVAAIEIIILVLFFIGFKKRFTYGSILAFHAVATFAAFGNYLSPFQGSNLLFFAAWPMLAACVMLFLFRKEDTLLQLDEKFA